MTLAEYFAELFQLIQALAGSVLNGMKSSSCPPREAIFVCDCVLLTKLYST